MITPGGLQDQMLAVVVKEEKPELALEKEQLITDRAEFAKKLYECENTILHILSTSAGNILEDASAIEAIGESKAVSDEIKVKEEQAVQTEVKIDGIRAGYVTFHVTQTLTPTLTLRGTSPWRFM